MKRIFNRVAHAFKHDEAAANDDDSRAAESASMTSVDSGVHVQDDVPPEPTPEVKHIELDKLPETPDTSGSEKRDDILSEPVASLEPESDNTRATLHNDSPGNACHSANDSVDCLLDSAPEADTSSTIPTASGIQSPDPPTGGGSDAKATAMDAAGFELEPNRPQTVVVSGPAQPATGDLQRGGPPPERPPLPPQSPPSSPQPHADDRLIRPDSQPRYTAAERVESSHETSGFGQDASATPASEITGVKSNYAIVGVDVSVSAILSGERECEASAMGDGDSMESDRVTANIAMSSVVGGDSSVGLGDVPENVTTFDSERTIAVEKSATEGSMVDSEGNVLETGTEDTGDDLDGKPKEKKKRRRKKKNKGGVVDSASVDAIPLLEEGSSCVTTEVVAANATETIDNETVLQNPELCTVSDPKPDASEPPKMNAASGRKTSKAPVPQTNTSKKISEPKQRRSTAHAHTRASIAKQNTVDSSSRSSTPSRSVENPARTRLKRDLQKAVSIESNSSTGSRTSTGSRPSSIGARKPSSTAPKQAATRRKSPSPSVSSVSTTASSKEDNRSSSTTKKSQNDRKASKAGGANTKKMSDANAGNVSGKGSSNKKLSSAQALSEKKTKASIAKEKKTAAERKKSEKVSAPLEPKDPAKEVSTDNSNVINDESTSGVPGKMQTSEEGVRPPLTQHDTIDDFGERPPLTQEDTILGISERPPLTEQETIEETVALPSWAEQQDRLAENEHTVSVSNMPEAEAVNISIVNGVNGNHGPASLTSSSDHPDLGPVKSGKSVTEKPAPAPMMPTLPPSGTALSPTPLSPKSPSPSPNPMDLSSRRSSVEVLDEGRSKLRRSASSTQVEPPLGPDPVLEVMSSVHADSEARLAARRQARAEAREIRMRELERQQREAELNGEKSDEFPDVPPSRSSASVSSVRTPRGGSIGSGRRGSEDSLEDSHGPALHLRDVRHELRELEEKLRKTMVTSAQLDNDKSTLNYQVDLLKDRLEDLQEAHTQLQREHRTRCSDHEQLKRVSNRLKEDLTLCKKLLDERDKLIAENGLVLVGDDEEGDSEAPAAASGPKALVSEAAAELLNKAGGGTLDSRLRRLGEEKNELEDQLRRLKLELEEERHMNARARISGTGAAADSDAVQREVARQLGEYRFKLQKSDQDITNLQTAVQRLENQVARYKSAAETAEKAEEELKGEKRKLQRELRESLTRVDELETTNSHLQKRLDKLKNARSNLLKDLSTE